ncbi:hypothetical protein B4U79_01828 [Dinothrombium tinctorium]|uniref:RanBD1 domain-containing protein n=1 Tax=Dinothrombium tinctorium TaxID=1965070 RepID=A0A3S3RS72_9ACAR|nr:hypothetical protein B4U79_01828 [Dinothrombium tinctorium]
MELRKHMSNEKAWIWNTIADFADEQPRAELLCIRFANVENAQKFYDAFEEAKQLAKTYEQTNGDLSDILTKVKLNDEGDENEQKHDSEDEKESEESETSGNETKEDQK